MSKSRHSDWQLAEEAAEWLLRRLTDRSPECSVELLRWLKTSPKHIDEFLLAQTTFAALRGRGRGKASALDIEALVQEASHNVVPFDGAPSPVSLEETAQEVMEHPLKGSQLRRKPRRWLASAAAALLFIGIGAMWTQWMGRTTYRTAIGEQRAIRLEDGSLLNLNTRSRIEVHFSRHARELRLLDGEALFTVAQDAKRPFRVHTANAVVQAIGTQFNVYAQDRQTKVTVLEGRVRVAAQQAPLAPSVAPALVEAGERVDVADDGLIAKHAKPDLKATVAWQDRRLVFRAVPLAEVAEQFNRYNEYQLRIVDDALGKRLIWGVFGVDEPRALVKFLQRDERVAVEEAGKEVLIKEAHLPGAQTSLGRGT